MTFLKTPGHVPRPDPLKHLIFLRSEGVSVSFLPPMRKYRRAAHRSLAPSNIAIVSTMVRFTPNNNTQSERSHRLAILSGSKDQCSRSD